MSVKFLTEIEVTDRTHIGLATLRRWRLENRGTNFHKFGSLVRYSEEELSDWEQSQPCGGDKSSSRIQLHSEEAPAVLRRSG